jgi:hypothetical protein
MQQKIILILFILKMMVSIPLENKGEKVSVAKKQFADSSVFRKTTLQESFSNSTRKC